MSLFKTYLLLIHLRIRHIILSLFCFGMFSGYSQEGNRDYFNLNADEAFNKALELRFQNPDSAVNLFNHSYQKFIQSKDTLNATKSLLEKSLVYENNAKYASSYDALWKALILNDTGDNINLKSVIYNRLGRIYSYYKREGESIKYLKKSLEIQKKITSNASLSKSGLVPYYYAIAKTHRELEHKELASIYLDSCYLFFSKENKILSKAYLDFEKATLLAYNNENTKAIEIMDSIYPWFQNNEPTYLVLFYKYLGDMYLANANLNKSEDLYRKAINISKENKSHIDFTPLIYESLTELYIKKNDYKNAFINLKLAKDLDAKFFDGRSSINQSLLEIKDAYRLEKERKEKQIQEQYLKQLEQEDEINNLQMIILLGSILFLVLIGYNFIRNLRAKHKAEKELIRRKNELEIQKSQELLELKNKELASSALQLIEKDEFLRNIKSAVKGKDDKLKIHEINKALKSISISNNQNWEEFKLRFIDVNKQFYDNIFEKFPNLSQGDQKICALIKLNFSSKEMARLLGISVESVHTSRHRIRKKMNLSRETNLEDFINSI